MIHLTRGPEPEILGRKWAEWTKKFLAARIKTPGKRPDSKQYGHEEVRVELRRMSDQKCFYCERRLTQEEQEIDHHVEVDERPELAFCWWNLYLSCAGCNKTKAPNAHISLISCIDPCNGTHARDHMVFDQERLEPRDGSALGIATIRKYSLNRDDLAYARCRALNQFREALHTIQKDQVQHGRRSFSAQERVILLAFKQPHRPFSLMFSMILDAIALD